MPIGPIYTANQAKKELYESNRDYENKLTWQNAILGTNAQAAEAQSKLNQSYIDASTDAYVQYLQNKNSLSGSNVVGVGRQDLLQQTELALQDAYNSYATSLQEGRAEIEENRLNQLTSIEEQLEKQAQYTADYTNAHVDYLKKLWKQYEDGENTLFDDPNWAKYTRNYTPLTDKSGNILRDKDGNIMYDTTVKNLISDDDLVAMLYDDKGLTIQGVEFFDQLENEIAGYDTGYSWSDYLKETNPELYEWAEEYNPWNYTDDGTNAGTARTMYGMMSDDYAYQYAERFGGLSADDLKEKWNKILQQTNKIATTKYSNTDKVTKEIASQITELADELGLADDFVEAGLSVDTINDILKGDKAKYEKLIKKQQNKETKDMILWGLFTPFASGAIVSSLVNASKQGNSSDLMKEYQGIVKQQYDKLIMEMTAYAMRKQRNAVENFNRSTGRL